jgi:DNA-directed RNA polymerase specialized sigma24 family protein
MAATPARSPDVIALDEALNSLSRIDRRKVIVVELRVFGGLTVDEIAEALDVSRRTVIRDWTMARAWLFQELSHRRGNRP